jgi:hypothetical protein
MQFQWQLAVSTEDGEAFVAAEQYLQLYVSGKISYQPSLEHCGILLTSNGKEVLASCDWGGFGRADVLVLEFEEAQKRLSQQQKGLIRTGDIDNFYPHYLLLEPSENDTTWISLIFPEDEALRMKAPTTQEVYDYVCLNIETIRASSNLKNILYPTQNLVSSLAREANIGRQLIERLGIPAGYWL